MSVYYSTFQPPCFQGFMDAAVRRNFTLGIIHESTWGAAMGLVNPFTILPLAAHALGRSVADAGLMEAALFAGVNAPQLLAAFVFGPRFSEPKACAWLHSLCLFGMACAFASLVWPGLDPDLRWKLFLASFILHWFGMGLVVPSWASLSSRNIPTDKLGRYFGWCFAGSGAAAVLTGALGASLVDHGGLAWGYPACCALALAFQIVSVTLLGLTRPVSPVHDHPGKLKPFLKARGRQLLFDRPFQLFLLLVFLMQFAGGATQLFTASLKDQGVPDTAFQWLNPALAVGGMTGSYWLGHLFDRLGGARPWFISLGVLLAALGLLVWGGGLSALALAYVGAGLFNAVYGSVNLPWVLALAGPGQTPAFMGLFSTLIAPWCFIAPYCLGKLARSQGVHAAFAVSALAALACMALIVASPSLRQKGRA
jgi:MFS family permease